METYQVQEGAAIYYLTFTIIEWLPVFIAEEPSLIITDSLNPLWHGGTPATARTRGMNDTFLEKSVGEMLLEGEGKSAAGILQAAGEQGIPLVYVDADNLKTLQNANISKEALGRIWQAAQEGYGIPASARSSSAAVAASSPSHTPLANLQICFLQSTENSE